MAHILVVAIRKGGAGKTTTSVNLACGLIKQGKKVLLVDLDDQANATMCAGINPFALDCAIENLFIDIKIATEDAIVMTDYGLAVLPTTPELEKVSAGMNATSIQSLKPILAAVADTYDYIIIDTQPGHSYLSMSALVAANSVLIPLQTHYLAMEGLARILKDIQDVRDGDLADSGRGHNPQIQTFGILPVMVQAQTTAAQLIIDKTKEDYPDLVLPIEVRLSVDFVNASIEGRPLVIAKPHHPGSLAYLELSTFVIQKTEGR